MHPPDTPPSSCVTQVTHAAPEWTLQHSTRTAFTHVVARTAAVCMCSPLPLQDGERRKEYERGEGADALTRTPPPVNPRLATIQAEIEASAKEAGSIDAFAAYLLGIVYLALGRRDDARTMFIRCVHGYPLLWSAWLDLAGTCTTIAHVQALELPEHWMSELFRAHVYIQLHLSAAALSLLASLTVAFPGSSLLKGLTAKALYDLRRMDKAGQVFTHLKDIDPHRLEDMDVYSHVLFVQGDRTGLASLAQAAHQTDRFRPTTCIVLANYLSMRRDHEKAIIYLRRALRLDPRCCEAWILMGHEYVELKQAHAAIECYRRATATNELEYRAWYGLGQAYELLSIYLYAVYYFRKAMILQPYDARMWVALGACSEKMDRRADAVAAYERAAALGTGDSQGATLALARLYRQDGSSHMASKYYSMFVQERQKTVGSGAGAGASEVAEGLLYLAGQAYTEGRRDAAAAYASRILSLPPGVQEVREARTLLEMIEKEARHAHAPQHHSEEGQAGATGKLAWGSERDADKARGGSGAAGVQHGIGRTPGTPGSRAGTSMSMSFASPDASMPIFGEGAEVDATRIFGTAAQTPAGSMSVFGGRGKSSTGRPGGSGSHDERTGDTEGSGADMAMEFSPG